MIRKSETMEYLEKICEAVNLDERLIKEAKGMLSLSNCSLFEYIDGCEK